MTINLDSIYPLIVPANYYVKGTWDLPHHTFRNQSFILTWVTFASASTINYLTQKQHQELNNRHDRWQQKSFGNLRMSIADDENFFSRFKLRVGGQQLLWLCFMNHDGIGSSRILLATELTKAFPNGYYLAFPDRSCGLVIANDITGTELKEIKDLIKSMYKGATTPMSEQLHSASDFELPEQWIQPLNKELSDILVNKIVKLRPGKL